MRGHRVVKVDQNQAAIVQALRGMGAAAYSIAAVGGGVPDVLCAFRGVWSVLEVKQPGEKLNATQEAWHAACPGKVWVVTTPAEAMAAVAESARPSGITDCPQKTDNPGPREGTAGGERRE